jgi:hypothetical protein
VKARIKAMTPRILFILKRREKQWGANYYSMSSGLLNSVSFIVHMLTSLGVEAKLVDVADNNCIDREVTLYKPTHVIIEAYWVVPSKFDVLLPLHPDVHWAVRNHSETPFLANEGIAFEWTAEYLKRGIEIMCNAPRAVHDMKVYARATGNNELLVTYAPNFYPLHDISPIAGIDKDAKQINIGCFGAIRPLKNHMTQAIAALAFAKRHRKLLRFHINGGRVEGYGAPILKNLQAFFVNIAGGELVEHDWMPHDVFLDVIGGMDMNLQVSFSETYNIVSCDSTLRGVGVVVSREVPWIGEYAHADPTSVDSIVNGMQRIWDSDLPARLHKQRRDLALYCRETEEVWLKRFK